MKHDQNSSHHCKNFMGLQHRCKSKFQRRRLSKQLHCCSQQEHMCICRTHCPKKSSQRIPMGSKCSCKFPNANDDSISMRVVCRSSHSLMALPSQFSSRNQKSRFRVCRHISKFQGSRIRLSHNFVGHKHTCKDQCCKLHLHCILQSAHSICRHTLLGQRSIGLSHHQGM